MQTVVNFSPKISTFDNGETYLFYDVPQIDFADLPTPSVLYKQLLKNLAQDQSLRIPLSGGIDSEILFRAAVEAGVDFLPVIINFKNDYNLFEIKNAYRLCKEFKKNPLELSLDLDDFYQTHKHLHFAESYGCRSPQLATHLWMLDQVDGYFIFPYNPLPLLHSRKGQCYIGFPPDLYLCYERYFSKNQREGISFFSAYSSEIIYSYLKLPIYLEALFDENFFLKFTSNSYSFKCEAYRQAGFKTNTNLQKATGFEQYRLHMNKLNQKAKTSPLELDAYDFHYRRPMEHLVQDPKYPAMSNVSLEGLYKFYSENPRM